MSRLFPNLDCYEIYPLNNLNHPIFDVVFPFDMYDAIAIGVKILSLIQVESIDALRNKVSTRFGIVLSKTEFVYVLAAVLKNKNYYDGEDLKNVRICTV